MRRVLRHFILSVVCICASGCTAGGDLGNRLVLIADKNSDTLSVRLIFGIDGSESHAGMARMAALVLTGPYSETGIMRLSQLRALGASLSASASREALTIDCTCPKSAWRQSASLVIEQLKGPKSEELPIDRLRARQHADLDSLRHDAWGLAHSVLWREHCSDWPPPGTDSAIDSISSQQLTAFFERVLNRDNYVMGLAGPVNQEDAAQFDASLQAELPTGRAAAVVAACPRPSGLNVRIVELNGLESATVLVGVAFDHFAKDTAAEVLALVAALHGVPSATHLGMDQSLRIERGLVSGIDIETARIQSTLGGAVLRSDDPVRRDYLIVGAETDPINALYVARIVIKELTDLNTAGLSPEDIRAMDKLLGSSRGDSDDAAAQMRSLVSWKWMEIGAYERAGYPAITPQLTRRAIRLSLDPLNLWVVAVVPDGQAFQAGVLSGTSVYRYPDWVDRREMRKLDQEYLSYRPFWEAKIITVLNAEELFR